MIGQICATEDASKFEFLIKADWLDEYRLISLETLPVFCWMVGLIFHLRSTGSWIALEVVVFFWVKLIKPNKKVETDRLLGPLGTIQKNCRELWQELREAVKKHRYAQLLFGKCYLQNALVATTELQIRKAAGRLSGWRALSAKRSGRRGKAANGEKS